MLKYNGIYGEYGGSYVPPVLEPALKKVALLFDTYSSDPDFIHEFSSHLVQYTGRPSPLYYASRLSRHTGAEIYLKREDLNHTGSHKINNTIGQILIAKRGGYKEIIAETGAGQHGVATATVAAMFGIKCKVFMGAIDAERQHLNVHRMKLLGADVVTTSIGTATLKDAVDAALVYFIEHPEAYYLLGSQVGPDPYPRMVGYFQSVIGYEARQQIIEQTGKLPDAALACVGGGSNAIGIFSGFLDDNSVELHGAEGGGQGFLGNTAATLSLGKPGVFQGTKSYCLVDEKGEVLPSHSIAAGLDYPGISPQHSYLKDCKRAKYHIITDNEAVEAYRLLSALEGIIPAIESSHAIALALKSFRNSGKTLVINLSGRGDKDVDRI
ncbi:MAG: tryptophan synthase subunit beta [Bacteroidetes bacterium GWF2_38_335]|nr:MAG: tryptophan synthase subunit beta [Bacteroidetes bacterium GWF2_38_335]HBS88008.1 tryptophan synthase subunit beta [Bacteroidales bacterium]